MCLPIQVCLWQWLSMCIPLSFSCLVNAQPGMGEVITTSNFVQVCAITMERNKPYFFNRKEPAKHYGNKKFWMVDVMEYLVSCRYLIKWSYIYNNNRFVQNPFYIYSIDNIFFSSVKTIRCILIESLHRVIPMQTTLGQFMNIILLFKNKDPSIS